MGHVLFVLMMGVLELLLGAEGVNSGYRLHGSSCTENTDED